METEANAKVVASVFWGCGHNLYNSLQRYLFCLGRIGRKVEFSLFFQIDRGKTASAARNWINSAPQTEATTFAFASVSILLLCMHVGDSIYPLLTDCYPPQTYSCSPRGRRTLIGLTWTEDSLKNNWEGVNKQNHTPKMTFLFSGNR